ncbi:MAG: MATE family efflux transporter, partial [Candidatus Aminicenantes bacterium]|nr:MATE family efflux transporter [Candidatus Aminicenantes bacterium]
LGAGPVVPLATAYGRVMFAATLVVFFAHVSMALLRAEGDVKRAMMAMLLGAGLNIILDPLFIYGLRMGVAGAAWATVISMSVTALLLCRWICFHKDMWITVTLKKFRFRRNALKDIFTVGFPSAIQHMAMSLSMLILNMVAVIAGGTDGVAVFSTGWRVATFATLPLLGIATAVTSVTGAAYGGKDYSRLDNAFQYAVRLGFSIEIVVAAMTFLAADFIAGWFTFSASSARLRPDLVVFLRTMCVFYPSTAFGMLSSAMFQGIGRGMNALAVTVIRTLMLTVPMAWLLAIRLGLGLTGLWWGVVIGNITGAAIAWTWARHSIRTLSSLSPPG